MNSTCLSTFLCWLTTWALATTAQAQEKAVGKELDPKTIAANQNIGASCYLTAHITDAGFHYSIGLPPGKLDLPVISFGVQPQGELTDGSVPFCLQFSHGALTEAHLKKLGDLKNLVGLEVDGYAINDATAKNLAAIKNLRALTLHNSQITGVGLRELAALKDFSVLYLPHTATDEAMKEMPSLKNLKVVNIGGTKITAVGLKELQHVKKLTTLILDCNMLTNDNLRALREAGLLHKLRQGSNTGGKRPNSAEDVQILDLNYAALTDAGLKELAPLRNVTWLNLNYTKVTDAGLKELARFKKLTAIHLHGAPVTDAGLKELEGLTNLAEMDLQGTKVTDSGMAYLREALPKCRVYR